MIGSGKSTAATEFVKIGYEKDSFAASLKDATAAVFGWDRDLLEGITKESRAFREAPDMFWHDKLGAETLDKYNVGQGHVNKYFTPRLALQLLGTNIFRQYFHQDIWLDTCENRLQKDLNKNVVISDCRFVNEIDMIKRLGGILIRVDRGERPDWYNDAAAAHRSDNHPMSLRSDVHSSEWQWVGTDVDHVIDNNGPIADLKVAVSAIANDIRRNPARAAVKNEKIISDVASLYT